MSRQIGLTLNLKEAYIIKHALRDKPGKDEAETKVYEMITGEIDAYKDHKRIRSMSALEWAENRMGLVIEKAPYQAEILKAADDGTTRKIVIKGATQIGMSEVFNSIAIQRGAIERMPVAILKACNGTADVYAKTILMPRIIASGAQQRGEVRIDVGSADCAAGLLAKAYKVVIADDADKYPLYADKNENPVTHILQKPYLYADGIVCIGSVPSIKGVSMIDEEYSKGTCEEWRHQCPACRGYHLIKFEEMVIARRGLSKDILRVDWSCPNCGCVAREDEMRGMNQKFIVQNDNSEGGVRSFFVNAFALQWITWKQIVQEWEDAQGDPCMMKVITNIRFGESY